MSEVKRFDSYNEDNDMIEKLNGPYVKHTALEHLLSLKDIELDTLKSELSAKDDEIKHKSEVAQVWFEKHLKSEEKANKLEQELSEAKKENDSWCEFVVQLLPHLPPQLREGLEAMRQQHAPKSGFAVISDSSIPKSEAHLRNEKGEVVGKIVNIDTPKSQEGK